MQGLYSSLNALLLVLALGALMQKRLRLPESFYSGSSTLVIRVMLPAMILASMNKDFSYDMAVTSFHMLLIAAVLYGIVTFSYAVSLFQRGQKTQWRGLNIKIDIYYTKKKASI